MFLLSNRLLLFLAVYGLKIRICSAAPLSFAVVPVINTIATHVSSVRQSARVLKPSRCDAGNLAFPLLLVGGLFLLSRRGGGAGGGGGFGGGGNNPMQMGKSKAKFQMEPNTGITFDDVAGVTEAKEDFEEVRPLLLCLAFPGCLPTR